MLETRVLIFQNPWDHSVPLKELVGIFKTIAEEQATRIGTHHAAGDYPRDSFGTAFLDPTAPLWKPSDEVLLATIAVGPEGESFIPNGIAKAVYHRDHSRIAGYGTYVDLTQSQDGDFTYGYSTQVDNTTVGASGQTELQDAYEAGLAAVRFNYEIRSARKRWLESHESRPGWFCNVNKPRRLYITMAGKLMPIFDSNGALATDLS